MRRASTRATTLFISLIFLVLFTALLFLQDVDPPDELLSMEAPIVNRTPLYSKGKLTGFRFCIGKPVMTFTYQDPDPRVESVWAAMQTARYASVRYSNRPGRNPTLWGLDAEGRTVAVVAEVKAARLSRWLLYFVGALASAAVCFVVLIQMLRARAAR